MSWFRSDRERRFTWLTLAVVAAIYASAGFAQKLAGAVPEAVFSAGYVAGLLLVLGAVATHGLRRRPGGAEAWVLLGILGAYFVAALRVAVPAERSHLIEYSVVALLLYEALRARAAHDPRLRRPALWAIAGTSLFGLVDELIQIPIPGRYFGATDVLFDFVAAVLAVGGSAALRWAKGRTNAP